MTDLVIIVLLLLVACTGTVPAVSQTVTTAPTPPPALSTATLAPLPTIPPAPTVAPTTVATSTSAPLPTARPATTSTTTSRVTGPQVAVNLEENTANSVRLYALDGSLVRTVNTTRLMRVYYRGAVEALGSSIYAVTGSAPPSLVTVEANGMKLLSAFKTPPSSLVVSQAAGGRLAWSTNVVSGTNMITDLWLGGPEGAQAKSIVKKTVTAAEESRALEAFQFSRDGARLYYSNEPVGLGGYILFGGASNLWEYNIDTLKSTELVKDNQLSGTTCIDDLAPNEKLVAYHCGDKEMRVLDLGTGKSSAITLPGVAAAQAKVLGDARFSPDSTRLAFAAARRNPDDEQGWILVSSGLTGASKLVATSPAKDYYELIAWGNADTLLLQSHNPQPAVWTVRADGSGLSKLADGQFLSLVGSVP